MAWPIPPWESYESVFVCIEIHWSFLGKSASLYPKNGPPPSPTHPVMFIQMCEKWRMINMLVKCDKMGGFVFVLSISFSSYFIHITPPTKVILFVIMFVCDHDN